LLALIMNTIRPREATTLLWPDLFLRLADFSGCDWKPDAGHLPAALS